MEKDKGPSRRAAAQPPASSSSSPPAAVPDASPAPNPGATTTATAGARKRKAKTPAAARKPRKPQDQGTNQAHVYYGSGTSTFFCVTEQDLDGCARVIAELPQPRSMSLVDLQLWIFKLFRLHPETQDLAIKGFFKQYDTGPGWCLELFDWKTHIFRTDKSWNSFVKKVQQRTNGMEMFMLYVDSSEIRHYDGLRKGINDDYSQPATVVLPGQTSLSTYFPDDHVYLSRWLVVVEQLAMTNKEIVAFLADKYGKQISPLEAWKAKQKALEMHFDTFYDSYNYVPRLLKGIVCNNHGTFADIMDTEVAGCKDFRVLHRIFWAFAQCIQAFQHCRPVLCIKCTPLCGKYQGMLLTAQALDANDYSIPVAFAIIEGKTKESWLWFLRNVKRAVVKERSGVCIIHEYNLELLDAIEVIRSNPQEPHPWRDIRNRWCIQHLAENFFAYFGDKKLMMMFKRLCQQKRLCKFVEIWKELDVLTFKFTMEKGRGANGEMLQESVEQDETELEAQSPRNPLDSVENEEEGDHAAVGKSKITKFSDWIRPKPLEKWSLVHDTNGARYGIMATNIADVLKEINCLPLSAIVKVTVRRMVEYFKNTSAAANKAIGNPSMNFPECVQDYMNSKMQKAQMHQVICMSTKDSNVCCRDFKVQSRHKHVTVCLTSKYTKKGAKCSGAKCSCNKPQLLHKPCSHVLAVCCQVGVSPATYTSPYYSLSYLVKTWSIKFEVSMPSRYPRNTMEFGTPAFVFYGTPTWIPDKKLECGFPAILTSDCIQTAMDEEEQ